MDDLPNDIHCLFVRCIVFDVGIYKSLEFRLVCSKFNIAIENIIYALPTFEKEDDQSLLHLKRDPRMPKVMIARLIQWKTRMHNQRDRSICLSIRKTEDLLADFSIDKHCVTRGKCAQVLATAAANTIYFSDIIKHLEVTDNPLESTLLENALIAATYMRQMATIKKLIEIGAKPTTRTRFFGDAMGAAARSGSEDILCYFLNTNRCSSSTSPAEWLSHVTALEAASGAGHEHIVSVLLKLAAVKRPQVRFDLAVQSAVRAKYESVALMLLSHRQPHARDKEHVFWVNLLRTASEAACDTVVDFVLKSSEITFHEEHTVLPIEDACRLGHVSTVRLLLSQPSSRTRLTGAAFLAAFHGRKETVDLLMDAVSESEEYVIADTLAGATLNGHIALIRHVLQRTTGSPDSALPHFGNSPSEIYVSAIHFWLDSGQDCPESKFSPFSATTIDQVLWTACEEGRIGDVRKLLSVCDSYENLKVLCSAAASKSHAGLLLYLCQFVPPYLLSAVALESKSRAIFEVFLSLGWDVNKPLSRISPPILGHVLDDECLVRWLLDHGADPNARCDWDNTPMSCAVSGASLPLIQLLFERGGSVRRGQLIHSAVSREESDVTDIIDLLLGLGASLHDLEYHDDPVSWAENKCLGLGTPLHGAIQLRRRDLVSYLLKRGADPMIHDSLGRNALALAETSGCEEIIQFLRDERAIAESRQQVALTA